MPRPRKPTAHLKIIGAFDRTRSRAREDDIETGAFPDEPPAHLGEEIKTTWCELVAVCPLGVLQRSDQFLVEIAASLLAEHRKDPHAMIATRIVQLRVCLGQLGLSPTDRSKLVVPAKGAHRPSSLLD